MFIVFFVLIGLSVGSLLNVIIYRLPESKSIVTPRSFCPVCKKIIPWYRNIPVITYIIQLGKCAECKTKISPRYPFIEALTGFFWYWAFINYGLEEALLFVFMTGILTAISFIDISYMIVPLSLIISAVIGLAAYLFFVPEGVMYSLWGIVTGIGYLGGMMLITSLLFKKQTMGFGDLQLILVLGAWLGPLNTFTTIILSAFTAIIGWGIIAAMKGFDRNRPMPYGPFLSFAAILIYMIDFNWLSVLFP